MTKRESSNPETPRRQPTSSENPPQAQTTNFWTTGKGVLTIVAIAVGITAVIMTFILSRLDDDTEFGQEAIYLDQSTDSVCDLGGVALQGSIGDTPDAGWVEHGGAWLPTSDQYGPGKFESAGEFSCFEHSPRGMLFAASAYTGQLTNPDSWEGDMEFFAGQHADAHRGEAEELFISVLSENDSALGGFRLVDYDGETAQIDMAVTSFDGEGTSRTSVLLDMVWVEGDWYINASGDELGFKLEPLSDLIGYQNWAA